MLPSTSKSILPILLLSSTVAACGPHNHILARERRQAPHDSEQDEAGITNAVTECTPYSFPAWASMAANYPTIWKQPADIVPTDTVANALFKALNSTIPNIVPKGTFADSTAGGTVQYDTATDPACWWTETKCTTPKIPNIPPDIISCPEAQSYGYTFDDGPNCSHNAFYDFLRTNNQKATMFYIGSNVVDWPYEAQRGLADGHEICVHTWSHPYMTSLTNSQAFAELFYATQAIKDIVGITPKCWRPPYGDVDDRIRYIANALGLQNIVWEEDTFDYDYTINGIPAVDQNYQNIIGNASTFTTTGPVVLSHELDSETMTLAEQFYPQLKAAYHNLTPVGVCHNVVDQYREGGYEYPNFSQYVAGTTMYSGTTYTGFTGTYAPFPTDISIVSGQSVTQTAQYLAATQPPSAATTSSASSSSSSGKPGSSTTSVTKSGTSQSATGSGGSDSKGSSSSNGGERRWNVALGGVGSLVALVAGAWLV